MITLYNADCLDILQEISPVEVCITSPPYNLNKDYGNYNDNKSQSEYSSFIHKMASLLRDKVKSHLFLNIGFTPTNPWLAYRVAEVFQKYWTLQNNIAWIKHIKIDTQCHGLYRRVRSQHYTAPTFEHIFHFTHTGKEKVYPEAVSGQYAPPKGKYASCYTEEACKKRHIADLKRKTAKSFGKKWQEIENTPEFQSELAKRLEQRPFQYLNPKDEGSCWYITHEPTCKTERYGHPAVFPIGLPLRCIEFSGAKQVLDPFMGIGTTGLACKQKNIDFVGIEMNETYYKIGCERLGVKQW